jgi:hypothetical protein
LANIGRYECRNCGPQEIVNPEIVLVIYPKGMGRPVIVIDCQGGCQKQIRGYADWADAVTFDYNGAKVEGFSFARGEVMTEEDIESWSENMDEHIDDFLDNSFSK